MIWRNEVRRAGDGGCSQASMEEVLRLVVFLSFPFSGYSRRWARFLGRFVLTMIDEIDDRR